LSPHIEREVDKEPPDPIRRKRVIIRQHHLQLSDNKSQPKISKPVRLKKLTFLFFSGSSWVRAIEPFHLE
jgi:hypothetical protein